MSADAFDRSSWERRWEQALREHGDAVATRPPNDHLVSVADGLHRGRALDAGCGHGAEAIWLAAHGWRVTAVDFAVVALDFARSSAEAIGMDVANRIEWVQGDLGSWIPPDSYDLVVCIYVHIAGSVDEMVTRLAAAVAPGGSILLVGHHPAPGQVQVSVNDVLGALGSDGWEFLVAEDRPRTAGGTGVDAVVHARRLPQHR